MICMQYAVLTQLGKTVVFNPKNEEKVAYFEIHARNGYIDDFERLWGLLSKEAGAQRHKMRCT